MGFISPSTPLVLQCRNDHFRRVPLVGAINSNYNTKLYQVIKSDLKSSVLEREREREREEQSVRERIIERERELKFERARERERASKSNKEQEGFSL